MSSGSLIIVVKTQQLKIKGPQNFSLKITAVSLHILHFGNGFVREFNVVLSFVIRGKNDINNCHNAVWIKKKLYDLM